MNLNELTPFEKEVADVLSNDSVFDEYVIHPILFDPNFNGGDEVKESPILARINFNMISDSNTQILSTNKLLKDRFHNDKTNKYVLKDLFMDQRFIICKATLNNIIESSVMSFSNYWNWAKQTILGNILEISDQFANHNDSCIYKFNKNMYDDSDNLQGFIDGYLTGIEESSAFTTYNKIKSLSSEASAIENYTELKAINLSQYITTIIVKTIHESLFAYLSDYRIDLMSEKSFLLKSLKANNYNMNMIVEYLIGNTLYNSLYNFTMNCLNPSIYNILYSAATSYFTMYNDVLVNYDSIKTD